MRTAPILVCLALLLGSAMSAQTVTAPARPEITEHYRTMLRYQRRMDGNVPDRAVVFIGDSLTQGLCTDAVACPSVNYGIGSDTTMGVLGRLAEYGSLKRASAVVLAVGVNDLLFRDNGAIVENHRRILATLPPDLPVVCSALLPIHEPIYGPSVVSNARIRELNSALKVLCSNEPRCVFADAGPGLVDGEGNLKESLQDGDGIHLNAEGNAIWIGVLKTAVTTAQMRAKGRP